jgi:hypothetical protein
MIIACKCGEKLKLPKIDIGLYKFQCQKCNQIYIYDKFFKIEEFVQSKTNTFSNDLTYEITNDIKCFICSKSCTENNNLQNGYRYHNQCLKSLISTETKFISEINSLKKQINSLSIKINELIENRTLWQKIRGITPLGLDKLSQTIKQLYTKLNELERLNEIELNRRKTRLTELYDYWLYYPPDWDDRRRKLLNITPYCNDCKRGYPQVDSLHIHHIVPISNGGTHKLANLVVLCQPCHQDRHSFSFNSTVNSTNHDDKVSLINDAISKKQYLSFKYKVYEGNYDNHIISPISLKHQNGKLTLIGDCHITQTNRSFQIKYIYKLQQISNLNHFDLPVSILTEAINSDKLVYFNYSRSDGKKSIRTIKPNKLKKMNGVLVIEGFDFLRKEIRTFALNRMSSIKMTDIEKPSKHF